MKDFAEAYREAHAKAREYMGAKRAGWAEPGKRTRDNHAILVPRREAVAMADELATAVYAKEVYLTWALNLQGFMVHWRLVSMTPWRARSVTAFSAPDG